MRRALLLLGLVVLAGCSLDPVRSKPLDAQTTTGAHSNVGPPESLTYDSSLHVDLAMMAHTPSGLYWRDLTEGTGAEAVRGSRAFVDYTGWFADARVFDTSKNAGKPYAFVLGQRQVIAGWDEGVAGMRVGGRRLLVIPSNLGYGSSGSSGVIPGNATLIFEVELVDVRAGR